MEKETSGSRYLDIAYAFSALFDPNRVIIKRDRLHPTLSPDFLKIFDRASGLAISGETTLIIDGKNHSLLFERYGSGEKGFEFSRLFFRGDDWSGNQAVITTTLDSFKVGVVANWEGKQILSCNRPSRFAEGSPDWVLADKKDLRRALAAGSGLVKIDVIDVSNTNPRKEVTILDLPIIDPFLAEKQGEARQLTGAMDRSISIGDVTVLSRGTVTEIMNQLDPRTPWKESIKKPTILEPIYPPAQEIARLIIKSLTGEK